MSKEMREQLDRVKNWKQFLNENVKRKFTRDGDAYKNYLKDLNRDNVSKDDDNYILLSKEEFLQKLKTDKEFAKKWGDLGEGVEFT